MKKINWKRKVTEKDYILAIIVVSVIVIGFFVYVNFVPKTLFEMKTSVEIIEITGDCEECLDIGLSLEALLKQNEDIKLSKKTFDYNSDEAKSLIADYNIEKIPAIIVKSKDITQLDLDEQFFSVEKDYALFDKGVPYVELSSGEIKGLVSIKEIYDSKCFDCVSLSQTQDQLESFGIKIQDSEKIPSSLSLGRDLIKENNLEFVPALLISKEIEEYWWVFPQIKGSLIKMEDYYVFEDPIPPYKDLTTGKVKGVVDVTYLTDDSCIDCFNITDLKDSFLRVGVFIDNEGYIEVSSSNGKLLIEKYGITAVPTMILSEEILDYEALKAPLEQVGTFEEDNKFIFRELDKLNVKYREL